MLRTREWARRYCDMLDGADEAPTVNELYKAIELDEDDLVKDAFVQADRYTDQSREEAMKWRMAYYHERSKVGDLQDEVDWLNAELHGAELEAARAERTCRRMPADDGAVMVMRGGLAMEFPYFECSECGAYVMDNARYCPNCGAKVVE